MNWSETQKITLWHSTGKGRRCAAYNNSKSKPTLFQVLISHAHESWRGARIKERLQIVQTKVTLKNEFESILFSWKTPHYRMAPRTFSCIFNDGGCSIFWSGKWSNFLIECGGTICSWSLITFYNQDTNYQNKSLSSSLSCLQVGVNRVRCCTWRSPMATTYKQPQFTSSHSCVSQWRHRCSSVKILRDLIPRSVTPTTQPPFVFTLNGSVDSIKILWTPIENTRRKAEGSDHQRSMFLQQSRQYLHSSSINWSAGVAVWTANCFANSITRHPFQFGLSSMLSQLNAANITFKWNRHCQVISATFLWKRPKSFVPGAIGDGPADINWTCIGH